jgi:hypothetical protein
MNTLEKTAGQIIDMQDDPGVIWDTLKNFWPEGLDAPRVGIEFDKSACLVDLDGRPSYPINSAENALASSMYFLMCGAHKMEKSAMIKIGSSLRDYRDAWEVVIPDGFIDFLKGGHLKAAEEEIEEVEETLPEMSKHAAGAIVLRMRVMEPLETIEGRDTYMAKMSELFDRVKAGPSPEEAQQIAVELEEADRQTEMSVGWGGYYPDPYDSIFKGANLDPLPKLETKTASYANVDWDGLTSTLSSDIVNQIKEDPSTIIPTLPIAQRMLVNDYVNA